MRVCFISYILLNGNERTALWICNLLLLWVIFYGYHLDPKNYNTLKNGKKSFNMVVLSCLKDEEDDEEETEEETEDISEGETEATESVIVEEDDDEWIEEERQSGDGEVRKDLDHLLFLIGF